MRQVRTIWLNIHLSLCVLKVFSGTREFNSAGYLSQRVILRVSNLFEQIAQIFENIR